MTNVQNNLSRRYLLGQLTEVEQAALETQFFADAVRLEEVWAAENQLVDDYVRERLPRTERQQFEQHYLASPRHRERVAFARQLLKTVDEATAQAAESMRQPERWANFWALLRGPQLAWGLALAALLVMLIGGTKLLRERAHLRAQLTATQTAQQQRERELAERLAAAQTQNEQRAAALAELERLRNATPTPSITPPPPAPKVLAFVLSAGLLRGSDKAQQLAIPPGTSQIELRLRLETRDYATYQIQLRTVEGAALLTRSQLKLRADQLAVALPANKLRAGDYILTLSGVAAAGTIEEVNRYFFRVSR